MDLRRPFAPPAPPMAQVSAPIAPLGAELRFQTVSATRDEAFLSELDASLSRAGVPELRALDAFTPRAPSIRRFGDAPQPRSSAKVST